jgi:Holliday junction resolvasome RuvABC endonuclease subunit
MILSLDASSKAIGYAFFDKTNKLGYIKSGVITFPKNKGKAFYRIGKHDNSIDNYYIEQLKLFQWQNSDYITKVKEVVIEAPIYARNTRVAITTGMVHGLIRSFLSPLDVEIHYIENMSWKKAFNGKGNARKEDTQALVEAIYEITVKTDDESDAIAIGKVFYEREDLKNDNK